MKSLISIALVLILAGCATANVPTNIQTEERIEDIDHVDHD